MEKGEILNDHESDDRVWIKYRSRTLTGGESDTYICFCCLPPADSTSTLNEGSHQLAFEREIVSYLLKGNILICGDMNARTGTLKDYIENDSDLPVDIPLNYTIDQEVPRQSKDTGVNPQGRILLDLCISARMRIINGRTTGDSAGEYTCYTPRGCSVVDYLIVSADLLPKIVNFRVGTLPDYSDHCPLVFNVPVLVTSTRQPLEEQSSYTNVNTHAMSRPLKWDKQVEEKFSLYLQQSSTIEKLSHLRQSLLRSSPNESAQKLTAFLTTAVDNCGYGENTNRRTKHSTRYRRGRTKFPINSWFNDECKAQKRLVNEIKKMFLQQPNNTNLREQFFKEKKVYKKIP